MMSLTKNLKPKTKECFFIADSKTCQVFQAFKQLSSAYGAELCPCKDMCKQAVFMQTT